MERHWQSCVRLIPYLIVGAAMLCRGGSVGKRPLSDVTVSCLGNCSCVVKDHATIIADCSALHLNSVPEHLPPSLQILDLSKNRIKHLLTSSFTNLTHLIELDLSLNLIDSLVDREGHDLLQKSLRYSGRSFVSNSRNEIKANRSKYGTQYIMTSGDNSRQASHLVSPFRDLGQLKKLNLTFNVIRDIHTGLFSSNKHLQVLDLSSNTINQVGSLAFEGLASLQYLYLNNNSLRYREQTFADSAFSGLTSLLELNLQTNQPRLASYNISLSYPDRALSVLVTLQTLRIDGLPSQFPLGRGFQTLTNLSVLDMSNSIDLKRPDTDFCVIPDIPETFFQNITSKFPLTVRLKHCGIETVSPKTFSYLPTLHSLSLKENNNLNFSRFLTLSRSFPETNIKELDLTKINNSPILSLDPKYFVYLTQTSLETLILAENLILAINPVVFLALHRVNLVYLSIANNKMTDARCFVVLGAVNKLQVIDVSTQNIVRRTNHSTESPASTNNVDRLLETSKRREKISYDNQDQSSAKEGLEDFDKVTDIKMNLDKNAVDYLSSHNVQVQNQTEDILTITEFTRLQQHFCPRSLHINPDQLRTLRDNTSLRLSRPNTLGDMYELMTRNTSGAFSYIDISGPLKGDPYIHSWPATLKKVYMKELKLGSFVPKAIFPDDNSVELVDSSKNFLWCMEGPVLNVKKLRTLDLSKNYCLALSQYFFTDMISLTNLDLSFNVLGPSLQMDTDGRTFSNLSSLRHLDLSVNNIDTLHHSAFLHNSQMRKLLLRNNSLTHFDPKISHMEKLEFLDLSHNNLRFLSRSAREDIDTISKTSKLEVSLQDNRIECSCQTLPFLIWFSQTNVVFRHRDSYTCVHQNGSTMSLLYLDNFLRPLMRECNGPFTLLVTVITFLVVVAVWLGSGIAFAFGDYYKGKLYFYYYISHKEYFQNFLNPECHGVRDVFVSYDDQEIIWRRFAANVLKPRLEAKGITTHFPEIDGFGADHHEPAAGRSTREVVEDSVLKGRKTLIVLTKDYFDDDDKELEVTMAKVSEDMRGYPLVVILKMEEVPLRKIPRHLRRYLKNHDTLLYAGDTDAFWTELVRKIRQ